jgi:NAD(P)-dependent dehydrogenase (short-subunit alcohol dehydrogenase family)
VELRDASVIVTGGASGLGEATVRLLAGRFPGCHVVVVDLQDERGGKVAAEVSGTYVRADITQPDDVIRAVDAAPGPLRGVVSCAGGGSSRRTIGRDGRFESAHPLDEFERVVRLNVVGTFNVVRLAATAMSRNEPDENGGRGAIVTTASVAGLEGQIGQAAYAAGKAGVIGMTLPIARDLSAVGVRVNTIAPGIFDTPPMRAVPEALRTSLGASVPFPRRLGDPSEFASLACELLTNDYLNGEVVRLDGAIRMQPK